MDLVITLSKDSTISTNYLPGLEAGQGVAVGWVDIHDPQHRITIEAKDDAGIHLLISALEDLLSIH